MVSSGPYCRDYVVFLQIWFYETEMAGLSTEMAEEQIKLTNFIDCRREVCGLISFKAFSIGCRWSRFKRPNIG